MQVLPLWVNAVAFGVAAIAIWWAGVRLERSADEISRRTGLGQAFTGVLLLATATSLPELATTVTAVALLGDATLAVYNLLGGIAFQTLILAVADRAKRDRGAMTYFSPRFQLVIQGVALVLLLQLAIAGVSAGGAPVVLSISVWTVLILATHLGVLYLTHRYRGVPRWTPTEADDLPVDEASEGTGGSGPAGGEAPPDSRAPWARFAAMSAVVLGGGWLAASSADVLADRTGLGSAFLGATLLALATSLPELSTTIAAARAGRYPLAISNVFGSNSFDASLLLLADVLHRGGTILASVEGPVVFMAAVGGAMTCIYLWGLAERQNRTVLGVGWDSAAAAVLYAAAIVVLYLVP
jgi:cation:H+ antiporter